MEYNICVRIFQQLHINAPNNLYSCVTKYLNFISVDKLTKLQFFPSLFHTLNNVHHHKPGIYIKNAFHPLYHLNNKVNILR